MFKNILLKFIFIILISCSSVTKKDIANFNNEIIIEHKKIIQSENDLLNSIIEKDTLNIDEKYQIFINQINNSYQIIEQLEEIDSQINLKSSSLKFIEKYKYYSENDYKKLIEIEKISDSLTNNKNHKKSEELSTNIYINLNDEMHKFLKVQNKLLKKYKIVNQNNN